MSYRRAMRHSIRRLVPAAAGAVLVAIVFAGPASAEERWITMYDYSYRPSSVRILPGEKVTFVNDDDAPHDAVGNGWSTRLLGYYDSEAVTFARAGTYRFRCSIHPAMRGTIYVGAAGGGGAGVTDPPTDTLALAPAADPSAGGPGGLTLVLAAWAIAVIALMAVLGRRARRRD